MAKWLISCRWWKVASTHVCLGVSPEYICMPGVFLRLSKPNKTLTKLSRWPQPQMGRKSPKILMGRVCFWFTSSHIRLLFSQVLRFNLICRCLMSKFCPTCSLRTLGRICFAYNIGYWSCPNVNVPGGRYFGSTQKRMIAPIMPPRDKMGFTLYVRGVFHWFNIYT